MEPAFSALFKPESTAVVTSVKLLAEVPKYKRASWVSPVPELPITISVVVLLTNLTFSLYNMTLACWVALPM